MKLKLSYIETYINDKWLATDPSTIKEMDVFRLTDSAGNLETMFDVTEGTCTYKAVSVWQARGDALIDKSGQYTVEAIPAQGGVYMNINVAIEPRKKQTIVAPPTLPRTMGLFGLLTFDLITACVALPILISAASTPLVFLGVLAGLSLVPINWIAGKAIFTTKE